MPYELDLLTRLVTGDLSPTTFNLSEHATHREFLCQRFGTHIRHFKVQYLGSPTGEFSYQHHKEFVFLELDDLPRITVTGSDITESSLLGPLLADVLPRFGLALQQLHEVGCRQVGTQFFLEVVATCGFEGLAPAKARYFYYHTRLLDEASRLRRTLPEYALQRPQSDALTAYVQHFQRTLQSLLTHAYSQLEPAGRVGCYSKPLEYSLGEVQQLVYTELEKLLAHVEQTFPEHLNLTARLSYRRRLQALTDVQSPLSAVLLALHSAETIPPRLLGLVRECLSRLFITVHDTDLSYQDLIYPRLLLRELHGRLQRGWLVTAQNLAWLLVRHNFNSPAFFGLVTAHLRTESAAAGSHPADRLAVVLFHLKLYRQLQPATEVLYVPALPPLRTQLINWLKAERDYLSKQVQATPVSISPAVNAPRILTPLSVSQMAQLLRTLYEAGVFGQANQRDLFRLLATNFRTPRQERISEKSLADKYYNAEESTRQVVEKVVAKMLAQLRQTPSD